jgi:hypothetical protein
MSKIFQFPSRGRAIPERPADVQGLIKIETTDQGEEITVSGAFTERLQDGVYALTKALGIFVDKIVAEGDYGYTRSEPISVSVPRPKQKLSGRLLEESTFGELR